MIRQFDLMMLKVFYGNAQLVGTFSAGYLQGGSVDFSTLYLKISIDCNTCFYFQSSEFAMYFMQSYLSNEVFIL